MIWQEKEINQLTDNELINANVKLAEMHANYVEKTSNPKFIKKVGNNIPTVNPSFIAIRDEVIAELKKREIIK